MTELKNRSLERGITIMEALARTGACTLANLHRETDIPKSTIRRLLGTLQSRRIVRRSLSDQKYRINITLPTSVGAPIPRDAALYVDIAVPILSELTREIDWPSDIQIIDGPAMRVIDSTRPLSPFHLYRGIVNRSINIFGSATGQACLAEMSEKQIDALIHETDGDKFFGLKRFNITRDTLLREIALTKARGYGLRLLNYKGETVIDDGLAALGIPVFLGGRVLGAISLLFPRNLTSPEAMADTHLVRLRETSARISADLNKFNTA